VRGAAERDSAFASREHTTEQCDSLSTCVRSGKTRDAGGAASREAGQPFAAASVRAVR
jgi:hypothetical protein